MMTNGNNHYKLVDEFMARMRAEQPELYHRICAKYPVVTADKHRRIRRSEVPLSEVPSGEFGVDEVNGNGYE